MHPSHPSSIGLVHVGFNCMLAAHRIVALLSPLSSPTRRLIRQAREEGRIIDMTCGRKTKSVIILDTGQIALAALHPETIAGRLRSLVDHEEAPYDHAE